MSKVKIWRNVSKTGYIGRPQSIIEAKVSPSACPGIAPGGKPLALGPGDEVHDDRGVVDTIKNSAGGFTVLFLGSQADVDADVAKFKFSGRDPLTGPAWEVSVPGKVAKAFVGISELLVDVSEESAGALNLAGNRVAAAKELEALTSAVEVKDATIEALRAEIAKLQRAGQKDDKTKAAVATVLKG